MSTMRTSEKIDLLAIALHGFHRDVTTPKKNRTADVVKGGVKLYEYDYADLTALFEHCKPALLANNLVFTSAGMTSRVMHISGQWIEADFNFDPAGLPPQQIGSALSYARRYCFQELLGICADDDDDAAEVPGPAPQKAAGSTPAPKKDPAPTPAPADATAKPPAPPAPGPKRMDATSALPKGWDGKEPSPAMADMEKVRFVGYAQPKTLTNGSVKMGVRIRLADGKEVWGDSWDPLEHKDIQKAILDAKKAKQDGAAMFAVLEREPKADGDGEWIKIAEWMPQ